MRPSDSLTQDDLLQIWRHMWRMRTAETRLTQLSRDGVLRGSLHLAEGQEALPAVAGLVLRKSDKLTVTYRGHGHVLSKGCDLVGVFGEILGRVGGLGNGKGGKMHLTDLDNGLLGANGIVGAGVPIAAGGGLASKVLGDGSIAMTVFGDGALNQGCVHEACNIAALWKLPLILLCENNLYAEMTSLSRSSAVTDLSQRMASYGIPALKVDGNDALAVFDVLRLAADDARAGKGPTFIEAMTYRTCGHYQADAETYRTKAEVEKWRKQSPLVRFHKTLKERNVGSALVDSIRKEAEAEISSAIEEALKLPVPHPDSLRSNVFA